MRASTTDREQLLHSALTSDDDDARLVYADWLEQQGDLPRADLIRAHGVARRGVLANVLRDFDQPRIHALGPGRDVPAILVLNEGDERDGREGPGRDASSLRPLVRPPS